MCLAQFWGSEKVYVKCVPVGIHVIHSELQLSLLQVKQWKLKCQYFLPSKHSHLCWAGGFITSLGIPFKELHNFRRLLPMESWWADIALERLILRTVSDIVISWYNLWEVLGAHTPASYPFHLLFSCFFFNRGQDFLQLWKLFKLLFEETIGSFNENPLISSLPLSPCLRIWTSRSLPTQNKTKCQTLHC